MINTLLLYLIKILHLITIFLMVLGPFLLKSPLWLLFIILIDITIITGWHIHGYCCLTDIEHALNPHAKQSDEKKSFITSFVKNNLSFIDEKHIDTILDCIPLLTTYICLIHLYL